MKKIEDGAFVGMEPDGTLVRYNADNLSLYNAGERLGAEQCVDGLHDCEILPLLCAARLLKKNGVIKSLEAVARNRGILAPRD